MPANRPFFLALAVLLIGVPALVHLPAAVGHAWLAAAFFWSGVPIGSIGFLLIMRLVSGEWRERLGPAMAMGTVALPVVAAAFVPVLVAMPRLYAWVAAPPEGFAGAWLQPWGFVARALLWFAGLALILFGLARWPARGQVVATIGLLFLVPVGSLIAIDWLMSLDPHFHSSGFGLQAMIVQFIVALMVAVVRSVRAGEASSGTTGALMLTLLILWGYFAYLQFFIIWSGNAPHGAAWYLARAAGGWGAIAAAAVVLHSVPLLALLAGPVRRSGTLLRAAAIASLIGDALFCAWLVMPVDGPLGPLGALAYVVALAVIGAPVLLVGGRR